MISCGDASVSRERPGTARRPAFFFFLIFHKHITDKLPDLSFLYPTPELYVPVHPSQTSIIHQFVPLWASTRKKTPRRGRLTVSVFNGRFSLILTAATGGALRMSTGGSPSRLDSEAVQTEILGTIDSIFRPRKASFLPIPAAPVFW